MGNILREVMCKGIMCRYSSNFFRELSAINRHNVTFRNGIIKTKLIAGFIVLVVLNRCNMITDINKTSWVSFQVAVNECNVM